jgi:hypothetical protein
MRRWALLAVGTVLLLGVGATAWAQADPSPPTTTSATPPPTVTAPPTTVPATTSAGTSTSSAGTSTTGSGSSTSLCAIGTTTTFCFPGSTNTTVPPTTQPVACDCEGQQVTTSNPAKYAERAQQDRADSLTCFNVRLTDSGQFIVSASGNAETLSWLFQSG